MHRGVSQVGLMPLQNVSRIIVEQQIELLEVLTGFETNNRYKVYSDMGHFLYYAVEDTSCCSRYFCGTRRGFTIRMLDIAGLQAYLIESDLECCCRNISVQAPAGVPIGTVYQECSCCFPPSFYVRGPANELMFKIDSPCCGTCCGSFGNVNFDILANDQKTKIGQITKTWGGIVKEAMTDADTFGVSFPPDLPLQQKACLLAATFAIDFKFYETSEDPNKRKQNIN